MRTLKNLLKLSLFTVLVIALNGCSDPSGSDSNDNQFLALENFTHVEIFRTETPPGSPTAYTYSISINLQTGDATGVLAGAPFTCLVDNDLRQELYEVIRSLTITVHNGACNLAGQLNYERFYSSTSEATIDNCHYSYVGNGAQAMSDLYKDYEEFCTASIPN